MMQWQCSQTFPYTLQLLHLCASRTAHSGAKILKTEQNFQFETTKISLQE